MRKYDGAILAYALKYALCDSTHAVVKFTEMVKEYLDCLSYADLLLFGRLCEQAEHRQFFHPLAENRRSFDPSKGEAARFQKGYCEAAHELKQVFACEVIKRQFGGIDEGRKERNKHIMVFFDPFDMKKEGMNE